MNRNKLMFIQNLRRLFIVVSFTLILVACKSQMPTQKKTKSLQPTEIITFPGQIVNDDTLNPTQILVEPKTKTLIPNITPQ